MPSRRRPWGRPPRRIPDGFPRRSLGHCHSTVTPLARAQSIRAAYRAALPFLAATAPRPRGEVPARLVMFSCRRDMPELVASLRSFLRHAGSPRGIMVVSDGSHRRGDVTLLARLHAGTRVRHWRDAAPRRLPHAVAAYAARHPMGRKLAVELALPDGREPVIYADADVLFFPGAAELAEVAADGGRPRALRDCGPYFDDRLLAGPAEAVPPVNGGFLLLHERPDWDEALRRLDSLAGRPGFFSEQTLLQVAMRASGARELDPSRYVVSIADRYLDADLHAGPEIALRHYTTSVRPKLWQALAAAGETAAGAPFPLDRHG